MYRLQLHGAPPRRNDSARARHERKLVAKHPESTQPTRNGIYEIDCFESSFVSDFSRPHIRVVVTVKRTR